MKIVFTAIAVASALTFVGCSKDDAAEETVVAATCGDVSIADMNWSSATLIANVDSIILREGFGCNTDLVPGDTMPTGTSMVEKGEPDIAPELWSNSMKEALERGVADKRIVMAGKSLSDGGEEGFWVPKYMVDAKPELATISGIIANADLFPHPEDPTKSMLMTCPAGWNCQIGTGNLFKAMNLADAGFELVDPGSAAGLSGAIAKAYERKEGWLGYYWAPTDILGKYEMVKVDFESGVLLEHFQTCITQLDCEDPQPSMFPPSPVHTVTTVDFASESPTAFAYIEARSFTNADMNVLLAWMSDNQADGEFGAHHFLKNYEPIWTKWVSSSVADKVRAAVM